MPAVNVKWYWSIGIRCPRAEKKNQNRTLVWLQALGIRKSLLELSLVTMGLFVGFFTLLLCDGMIEGITASQRSASRYRSISVVFSKEDAQAAIGS